MVSGHPMGNSCVTKGEERAGRSCRRFSLTLPGCDTCHLPHPHPLSRTSLIIPLTARDLGNIFFQGPRKEGRTRFKSTKKVYYKSHNDRKWWSWCLNSVFLFSIFNVTFFPTKVFHIVREVCYFTKRQK